MSSDSIPAALAGLHLDMQMVEITGKG